VTFTNGTKYAGQFKNDDYHGQGTLILPTGEKYAGEWKNEKLCIILVLNFTPFSGLLFRIFAYFLVLD
jgi:hypothetical protein